MTPRYILWVLQDNNQGSMVVIAQERIQRVTVVSVKAKIMVAVVTGEEPGVVTQS